MKDPRSYSQGKMCSCGTAVSNNSRSGLCRLCFNRRMAADPARRAKVSSSLRKYLADPANKAKHDEQSRRAGKTKRLNPEWRERASRIMREIVQPISIAKGANLCRDYRAMSAKGAEAKMAWCPPEYRETYRDLRRKGIKKLEARQMVRDTIARDKRRQQSEMSPFERQMRALERGARLVANDQRPSLANPGIYRAEDAA